MDNASGPLWSVITKKKYHFDVCVLCLILNIGYLYDRVIKLTSKYHQYLSSLFSVLTFFVVSVPLPVRPSVGALKAIVY